MLASSSRPQAPSPPRHPHSHSHNVFTYKKSHTNDLARAPNSVDNLTKSPIDNNFFITQNETKERRQSSTLSLKSNKLNHLSEEDSNESIKKENTFNNDAIKSININNNEDDLRKSYPGYFEFNSQIKTPTPPPITNQTFIKPHSDLPLATINPPIIEKNATKIENYLQLLKEKIKGNIFFFLFLIRVS
jgi:hypothetical protein